MVFLKGLDDPEAAQLVLGLEGFEPSELRARVQALERHLQRLLNPKIRKGRQVLRAKIQSLSQESLGWEMIYKIILAWVKATLPAELLRLQPPLSDLGLVYQHPQEEQLSEMQRRLKLGDPVLIVSPEESTLGTLEGDCFQAEMVLERWPMISHWAGQVQLLFPAKESDELEPQQLEHWTHRAEQALLAQHMLERQERESHSWKIFMAESKGVEPDGRRLQERRCLALMVLSPEQSLPPLPPDFDPHKAPKEALKALETLLRKRGELFLFNYRGPRRKRQGPYPGLWRALALVLEEYEERLEGSKLCIHLGSDSALPPGEPFAPEGFPDFLDGFSEKIELDGPHLLADGEHGSLGYLRAAALLNRFTWSREAQRLRRRLLKSPETRELPYAPHSLDEARSLLREARRPGLGLLKMLGQREPGLLKQLQAQLENPLVEAFKALSPEEWEDLAESWLELLGDSKRHENLKGLLRGLEIRDTLSPLARLKILICRLALEGEEMDEKTLQALVKARDEIAELQEISEALQGLFELYLAELRLRRFDFFKGLERVEALMAQRPEGLMTPLDTFLLYSKLRFLASLDHSALALLMSDALPERTEEEQRRKLLLQAGLELEVSEQAGEPPERSLSLLVKLFGSEEALIDLPQREPEAARLLARILSQLKRDWSPRFFNPERIKGDYRLAFWGALALRKSDRSLAERLTYIVSRAGRGRQWLPDLLIHCCYQRELQALNLLKRERITVNRRSLEGRLPPSTQAWLKERWVPRPRNQQERLAPLSFSHR